MKKLITTLGLLMVLGAFSGCTLYFGPDDDDDDYYSYCDASGCWTCDSATGECWADGGGLGCSSNYDCAAACYCDPGSGTCIETGFCTYDEDCAEGYSCDDRASCVPDDTTSCWETGCPWGYYCDSFGGGCVPSTTCTYDSDCGGGYTCQAGTCTPSGCTSDDQCAAGCVCDTASGGCIETSYCSNDTECPSGQECDESRSTCVPDTTPPSCAELTDAASCDANTSCVSLYSGVNCTEIDPSGPACSDTGGGANCRCDSYVFAACVDAAP